MEKPGATTLAMSQEAHSPRRSLDSDTFSAVLRQAIADRGVTLTELHKRLTEHRTPVGVSTLSYWRSGERRPEGPSSLDAVAKLEQLLELPRGTLLNRVGPSRRTAGAPLEAYLSDLIPDDQEHKDALRELDLDDDGDLAELSVHAVLDLDALGLVRRVSIRSVVRSCRDGADRIPLVLRLQRPSAERAEFKVTGGGHLGRPVVTLAPDLYGSYLMLERPLFNGETTVIEYEMSVTDPTGLYMYEQHLVRRVHEVLIWVRFHPDTLPQTCEAYRSGPDAELIAPVDTTTPSVHHCVRNVGPGTVGVRWTWPQDPG